MSRLLVIELGKERVKGVNESKKEWFIFLTSLTLDRFYLTKEEKDSSSKSYSVKRLLSLAQISVGKSSELRKLCLADSGYSSFYLVLVLFRIYLRWLIFFPEAGILIEISSKSLQSLKIALFLEAWVVEAMSICFCGLVDIH